MTAKQDSQTTGINASAAAQPAKEKINQSEMVTLRRFAREAKEQWRTKDDFITTRPESSAKLCAAWNTSDAPTSEPESKDAPQTALERTIDMAKKASIENSGEVHIIQIGPDHFAICETNHGTHPYVASYRDGKLSNEAWPIRDMARNA